MQDKIIKTEQSGVEKIYDYPYNKVFRSLEDTAVREGWMIQESDIKEGYIYLAQTYFLSVFNAGITVKMIDEDKTAVKFLYFNSPYKFARNNAANHFFSKTESLLIRKE